MSEMKFEGKSVLFRETDDGKDTIGFRGKFFDTKLKDADAFKKSGSWKIDYDDDGSLIVSTTDNFDWYKILFSCVGFTDIELTKPTPIDQIRKITDNAQIKDGTVRYLEFQTGDPHVVAKAKAKIELDDLHLREIVMRDTEINCKFKCKFKGDDFKTVIC